MTAAVKQGQSQGGICLIVEDSLFDQRMFVRTLRAVDRDIPVLVAESLRTARSALMRHATRFVLLDNSLPDGLGVDFAQEMADAKPFRDIPKILVTDWPSPFMFEKARRAGVLSTIDKGSFGPVLLERLIPDKKRTVSRQIDRDDGPELT